MINIIYKIQINKNNAKQNTLYSPLKYQVIQIQKGHKRQYYRLQAISSRQPYWLNGH